MHAGGSQGWAPEIEAILSSDECSEEKQGEALGGSGGSIPFQPWPQGTISESECTWHLLIIFKNYEAVSTLVEHTSMHDTVYIFYHLVLTK